MDLLLPLPKVVIKNSINARKSIVAMGSCFVENIGGKLNQHGVETLINPLGIVFNASSIVQLLNKAADGQFYTEEDLEKGKEQWFCYQTHGAFSDASKKQLLNKLNTALEEFTCQLKKSSCLMVTLGSAHAYRLKSTNQIVANCHKQPQQIFDKVLLTADEMYSGLEKAFHKIKKLNAEISFIFTVSPVILSLIHI